VFDEPPQLNNTIHLRVIGLSADYVHCPISQIRPNITGGQETGLDEAVDTFEPIQEMVEDISYRCLFFRKPVRSRFVALKRLSQIIVTHTTNRFASSFRAG
jgi:hypothetical protein